MRRAKSASGKAAFDDSAFGPGKQRAYPARYQPLTVAILNIDGMDDDRYDMIQHVGLRSASWSGNPLVRVITARAVTFSGFDRLAIDNAQRRRSISSILFTGQDHKNMVHGRLLSFMYPSVEITLHSREGGKVSGQLPPLVAGRDDMEDRRP